MWFRLFPAKTVDEEFKTLGDAGHEGSLNDRIFYYLGALSITGALTERLKKYRDSLYADEDYVEDDYWEGP